jgi:hypothetical protein
VAQQSVAVLDPHAMGMHVLRSDAPPSRRTRQHCCVPVSFTAAAMRQRLRAHLFTSFLLHVCFLLELHPWSSVMCYAALPVSPQYLWLLGGSAGNRVWWGYTGWVVGNSRSWAARSSLLHCSGCMAGDGLVLNALGHVWPPLVGDMSVPLLSCCPQLTVTDRLTGTSVRVRRSRLLVSHSYFS